MPNFSVTVNPGPRGRIENILSLRTRWLSVSFHRCTCSLSSWPVLYYGQDDESGPQPTWKILIS